MSKKGIGLADVEYWTLEDVEKFTALLNMEEDMASAYRAYLNPEKE